MEGRGRAVAAVAGLLILVLASVIFITSRPRDGVSPVEGALRDMLSPVLSAVSTVSRTVTGAWNNAATLRDAHEENERLREQLAVVWQENARLEELERQNRILRQALQLPEGTPERVVFAEVIARPLNNWWSVLTINKGLRHGVEAQMGVIASDGVVGHVRSATEFTADVVLLIDPRGAVGGIVQRTGQPVLVEGLGFPGAVLRLRPLDEGVDIEVGDKIVTSGMSRLFSKGIPIGTVDHVELGPYGLSLEATVRPFVEFGAIEFVAVVTTPVSVEGADGAVVRVGGPAGSGLDQQADRLTPSTGAFVAR